MVEYNDIELIEDLFPLAKLPLLTELRLEGNPVCRLPLWDYHVIYFCKELRLLNGKPVNRKNAKFAKYEVDILNSLYYSNFVLKILKLLTRIPKISTEQLNKLICTEIAKVQPGAFKQKIRSQHSADKPAEYINFLFKEGITKQNEINRLASKRVDPQLQQRLKSLLQGLSMNKDFGNLANLMKQCASANLNAIGIVSNEPLTNSLQRRASIKPKKFKSGIESTNSLIEKAIDIAKQYLNPIATKIHKPKKYKVPLPAKTTPRKMVRSHSERIGYHREDFLSKDPRSKYSHENEFDPRKSLEEYINHQIRKAVAEHMDILKVDPNSMIEYHSDIFAKRPSEHQHVRTSSSSDDEEWRGLTFDVQLRRELKENNRSLSENPYSDSDSSSHPQKAPFEFEDDNQSVSSYFAHTEKPTEVRVLPPIPPIIRARANSSAGNHILRFNQIKRKIMILKFFRYWKNRSRSNHFKKHRRSSLGTISNIIANETPLPEDDSSPPRNKLRKVPPIPILSSAVDVSSAFTDPFVDQIIHSHSAKAHPLVKSRSERTVANSYLQPCDYLRGDFE